MPIPVSIWELNLLFEVSPHDPCTNSTAAIKFCLLSGWGPLWGPAVVKICLTVLLPSTCMTWNNRSAICGVTWENKVLSVQLNAGCTQLP